MTDLINDEAIQEYQDMVGAAVIPDYFLVEQFCNSGVQSIDYVIPPVSSADPAAASLETGAPPLQQVKPSLGGAVFPRQQYNGALRLLSNILAYLNKGNNFTFDTNNTAGYTIGAVLFDYNSYRWVRSLKANNTSNFVTNPTLIDGVNWDFITVNPKTANAFTIAPTVPTLPIGTNTTQAASTAFVQAYTPLQSKYDFVVTGVNTPTFAAGEEYIIYPTNIGGYVEFELTFLALYQVGAPTWGEVTAKFSVEHTTASSYPNVTIKLLSLGQSGVTQNITNLLTFTTYQTTAPYVINGVTLPSSNVIYTVKLNNTLSYAGTINSVFAKVNSNTLNAYNAMTGTLADAVLGVLPSAITGNSSVITAQYVAYLGSPAFTGTPTAPTAPTGTNTTQLATMAALYNATNPNRIAYFAANGTFTVPAGITSIYVTASAGGGGGGGNIGGGTNGTATSLSSLVTLGGGGGGQVYMAAGGLGGSSLMAGGQGSDGVNGLAIGGKGGGPWGGAGRSSTQLEGSAKAGSLGSGGGGTGQSGQGAGGGGSGEYIQCSQRTVTPLSTIAITIGTGGTGGAGIVGYTGGNGGNGFVLIQW